MIAAGMGLSDKGQLFAEERASIRLRQISLMTLSSDHCSREKINIMNEYPYISNITRSYEIRKHQIGIICVEPNYAKEQCTSRGDSGNLLFQYKLPWQVWPKLIEICCFSGGPVVSENSGSLMALMSMRRHCSTSPTNTDLHIFTYLPYYYKWIESVTGLELPKCTGPQI